MHKVVLVGAGSICRTHVKAFEGLGGRAKIVAIVSRHAENAQKVIDEMGLDARAYADHRSAIETSSSSLFVCATLPMTAVTSLGIPLIHCSKSMWCTACTSVQPPPSVAHWPRHARS